MSDASAYNWDDYHPTEEATLLFLMKGEPGARSLLLIRKKRGLGQGKINAPGGRLEAGETARQAAVRECGEEVGIWVTEERLQLCGRLEFRFLDGYCLAATVFSATWKDEDGVGHETEEALPLVFLENQLPYEEMWSDDRDWLPLLLKGTLFWGRYEFDHDKMVSRWLLLQPEPSRFPWR